MDHLTKLRHQLRQQALGLLLLENVLLITIAWALNQFTTLEPVSIAALSLVTAVGLTLLIVHTLTSRVTEPIEALWRTIIHLSPTDHGTALPKIDDIKVGQELVAGLTAQIYQLAASGSADSSKPASAAASNAHSFIAQNLPLPLFTLDATETITFANTAAANYIGMSADELIGKNVYMVLDMSFPSNDTFDSWLKEVKAKSATASSSWERVRLNVRDNHPELLFDLASYYNRDNPDKTETILVLFDHTKQYSQDEQAVSFMALSVHELRTPLTLLRGYIEVFEDELGENVAPELQDFMLKMRSQAEQLTAFVNNILNVARVDDDQLELQLQEEQWAPVLKAAIENLGLRAKVRGITLHCRIADNLPAVGLDRISILEVINNLVDNAIKYSGTSKTIEIDSHLTQDGLVETTVQDFGLGISTAIVPNLFTKFYRDHRNRAQIGGTGLGLYLSKALVDAHGGTLWVRTKEGEGSTFGFTLVPYAQMSDEAKQGNQEITRSAHGWIKNHSLYRR